MAVKTIIHVNQHNIRTNAKANCCVLPVLTVKDYKRNRRCHAAMIVDATGKEVARVVYSPSAPLSCGARVWIETQLEVITV